MQKIYLAVPKQKLGADYIPGMVATVRFRIFCPPVLMYLYGKNVEFWEH